MIKVRRCNLRDRPKMTTEDRARLRNIAERLQAIAHKLRQFEKTTNDPGLKQAGTSAAMALAWIGLVDNLQANDGIA